MTPTVYLLALLVGYVGLPAVRGGCLGPPVGGDIFVNK